MSRANFVLASAMVVALGYAASPYFYLWRLSGALQAGDARALERMIDWDGVRRGLKEDIAEGIVGAPEPADSATPVISSNKLPPFGASFISGIAGSIVDQEVTPQHLASTIQVLAPSANSDSPLAALRGIDSAFFESPTRFVLRLHCPGQEADEEPLRLRLELRQGSWQIVRAWIPQDLIDRANSRT